MKASEAKKISKSIDVPQLTFQDVLKEIETWAKKGSLTLVIRKERIKDIEGRLKEHGYDVYQYQKGPDARLYKVISWQNPTK